MGLLVLVDLNIQKTVTWLSCFIALCFPVLCILKVVATLHWAGIIFPTEFALFASLCHILATFMVLHTFSSLSHLLKWSVIFYVVTATHWSLNDDEYFIAINYFLSKVNILFFQTQCNCAHHRLQYNVKITIHTQKQKCDLFYCDICFILVVWNQTFSTSVVCL